MKIIAFGDIHGCPKATETAIKLSEEINATAVFLGDYVDRGPDSLKVLKLLIDAKRKHSNWRFLRGNHDQMLLDLINGKALPEDDLIINLPTGEIGSSYRQTKDTYLKWLNSTSEFKKEVVKFLKNTEFYIEINQWIFVHAILNDSSIALTNKSSDEFIWNYQTDPIWEGKRFIHGHYTTDEAAYNNQGININTKCGYGGKLTGLLVDATNGNILQDYSISEEGILL
ncbi:metallophosphoesterase [Aequorivita sinensis]|uniref:metallophosphoesterase n=1 Tax=Aequorivita sinensis TaxID=1382458 RepID=UPI00230132C9|nr:metallophosphoesterase [Aequorivita sinensis]